jgi:hypothetical protein
MSRKSAIPVLLVIVLVIPACILTGGPTPTAIPTSTVSIPSAAASTPTLPVATVIQVPSDTPLPTNTQVPSNTPLPTDTQVSNTPQPTPTITVIPVIIPTPANYVDDRSTPWQVIISFYNAINRQEYSRAYGYWADPSTMLGSFNAFAAGYQDTASVDLVFGEITSDAYMSQVDYTIPVLLKTTARNNTHTNSAACYVVHEVSPDVMGTPPNIPMSISKGSARASEINLSDASALATACNGYTLGGATAPITSGSLSIDKSNFLDDRSGPIETVSSFLNALNRKQYVRAYSYFDDPAAFPGPYGPYAAGYSNTDMITATFGTVQSEGAAGSEYYKVPLSTKVLTTTGGTQTFVGCYTLRISQPAVQAVPPFRSMGITTGKFTQVDNNSDVNSLLPSACK